MRGAHGVAQRLPLIKTVAAADVVADLRVSDARALERALGLSIVKAVRVSDQDAHHRVADGMAQRVAVACSFEQGAERLSNHACADRRIVQGRAGQWGGDGHRLRRPALQPVRRGARMSHRSGLRQRGVRPAGAVHGAHGIAQRGTIRVAVPVALRVSNKQGPEQIPDALAHRL